MLLLQTELIGQLLSIVQLITPPPLELVDVPPNGFPSGIPFVHVFVSFLHVDPAGQSLFLSHLYSQRLSTQEEPNGQLLLLVHEYEHRLLEQAVPVGQLLLLMQLITSPLEDELISVITVPELLKGFPNGTPPVQTLLSLHFELDGQSLSLEQRYLQTLLSVHLEPNGQSLSLIHE